MGTLSCRNVPNDVTTSFIRRLRARDPAAWFELWETFGPVLRAQLARWGGSRIGPETVRDLSQETLAALTTAIDRHDPSRGARFSTWLLAIARYTLGDELDRRNAWKRGRGVKPLRLDLDVHDTAGGRAPDQSYEQAVFDAKVEAALRQVERSTDLAAFSVYRMRILESRSGVRVAQALGISEPTVSRRLAQIRGLLRERLRDVVERFSFTEEELAEPTRNGVDLLPTKEGEARFDEAIAEIYHRSCARRAE